MEKILLKQALLSFGRSCPDFAVPGRDATSVASRQSSVKKEFATNTIAGLD